MLFNDVKMIVTTFANDVNDANVVNDVMNDVENDVNVKKLSKTLQVEQQMTSDGDGVAKLVSCSFVCCAGLLLQALFQAQL